ncbi:MAG: iron reductase [Pseudanabaena sp. SU_2_4]|nr:iron reductase [Pseudanabaena sp. SU_2_4]
MRRQVLIFLAIFLSIYAIALLSTLFVNPGLFANIVGFLSLLSYIATLLPSLIKVNFPSSRKGKIVTYLLKYRRHIGVTAFSLGLNHGVLLIVKRNLDLLDFHTYIHYFQGFSLLLIFTTLAFTSSDEAVKKLKSNWKKLHQLTYIAIFLLPWHILDKMSGHWTYITPVAVLLVTVIASLFAIRRYKEKINLLQKS